MVNRIILACMAWGSVFAIPARAADPPPSRVEVRAAPLAVQPGKRIPVGIRFSMDPGWHTYAADPGDSGMPPAITVKGPPGLHIETWKFPPAKTFRDAAGTTYGYEHEVVLLGAVHLPPSLKDGESADLTFAIDWLVCKEVCVPLESTVSLRLTIGTPEMADRLVWERFLEAGGWSACTETQTGTVVPEKEIP